MLIYGGNLMGRQKAKINFTPFIVGVVFIILIIGICVVTREIEQRTPSKEKADTFEYFGFTGDENTTGALGLAESEEVAMMVDDTFLEERGVIVDNRVYVPVKMVTKYLNKRFYWDSNENLLLFTTPSDIVRAEVGSNEYSVGKNKQSVDYQIVKTYGSDACYVALDFVNLYTGMIYDKYENPNRIHIYTKTIDQKAVSAKKKVANVRTRHNIKTDILTALDKGTSAYVLEEGKNWYKVYTEDCFIGYVRKKECTTGDVKPVDIDFEEPVYSNISKNYTINLAWHQVSGTGANSKLASLIENVKGVNTISPTWFSLSDNEGNISSLASESYVSLAHRCGMEVWALVDNFKAEVSTKEILSYSSKRERLVNQLISEVVEKDIDGLNIDFESLAPEAGEDFIQFIRELSTKCRANGIVLSIDNYVPGYTDYYDREEQGIVADYVIIMGYDEHNSSSTESGSVASLPFVREGIEATLSQVPANKVINAIPFYSRLWKETPKTEEEIAAEDATSETFIPNHITSEAMGMSSMDRVIANSGVTPVWDDTLKQNYLEYEYDGSVYKMWIEDNSSIEEKMKLIKEYGIAGVAEWKLGLEKAEIWDVIVKYTN